MILVDTSVWIDHFRGVDGSLTIMLGRGEVLVHPWVIGELALGGVTAGSATGRLLTELPQAIVADHQEVMQVIDSHSLARRGIGYVDVHLIVSTVLTAGARLWSRDRRLDAVATELDLAMPDV